MKKPKSKNVTFSNLVRSKMFLSRLICLITIVLIYSCTNGSDESTDKIGGADAKNKTGKIGRNLVEDNVNQFSQEIFIDFGIIDVALRKNSNINFSAQNMQMLNSANNENELKVVFENAGISNSQEIINILKNIVQTQEAFILQNPDFYNLTVEKQIELLNMSVEAYNNSNPPDGLSGTGDCARTFNKTINRCAGDFGTCAVFAVAGAYAGLAPGLLAATYCMVSKVNCDNRAKEDFKECEDEAVSPDGPPPPVTGQITVHCVRDSCWTTDSNGKYIERID